VLPFKNDSPDPENENFCNGMMEDILYDLVKINDLNVKSRNDIEPYRETNKSLKEIGKELGVANILEGSVRKQGNRFKMSIQLILAESGFTLWSDTFEGDYSEGIFKIQSNIAQEVATALNAVITSEEKEKIERVPTSDIKAYEFYIRAHQLVDSYWKDHETKYLPEAQRLLNKALEIDPGYKMAIEAKGVAFLAQSKYDSVLVYANRLKDLNPNSARGYYLKGEYYNFTNVPDSAIENYLHAIKLYNKNEISDKEYNEFQIGWVYCVQKNDYQKGLIYLQKGWDVKQKDDWAKPYMVGNIFRSIGDYERSTKYYQMSLGIEESPLCIESYSNALVYRSRLEEALSFLDTICKEPQSKVVCSQGRFYIHLIRKEFDLAEQSYTNFLNAGGTPDVSDSIWLSYLYKETGKKQAAITLLKRCQASLENQTGKNNDFELYLNLSSIYALLNNKEEALKNLTRSVDIGLLWGWHDFLEICLFFENLWNNPDFKAIVHRAQNEKAIIRSQVKKMEQSGETNL
jgi:TolB-like protein